MTRADTLSTLAMLGLWLAACGLACAWLSQYSAVAGAAGA
jgi:hypothetical protein